MMFGEEQEPKEQRHHIVFGGGVDGRLVNLHGDDGVGVEDTLELYARGLDDDKHTDALEASRGGARVAADKHQEDE